MILLVILYIVYFVYSQLTETDYAKDQVTFIVNVATLLGIAADLEERRKKV